MASKCECCWKEGPSIDNSTRQKIWEGNFRTREALKGFQQAEHFWSFQTTKENGEYCMRKRFGSLQSLGKIGGSSHCSHNAAAMSSMCQLHSSAPESPTRFCRDAATETCRPYVEKPAGRRVQLHPAGDSPARPTVGTTSKACPRYKPPDWGRNEPRNAKEHRKQSLQKLRKNEDALHQMMSRSTGKKGVGNWGTEYTRSYKEGTWPKTLGVAPRQSRAGTPMPRSEQSETPMMRQGAGYETPLSRQTEGYGTPMPRYVRQCGTPMPRAFTGSDTPLFRHPVA